MNNNARNSDFKVQDRLPFVSVIIPVYNDSERLKFCLESLDKQTYPRSHYEIIVIDNGSDESIQPVVGRFSQVRVSYESRAGSYSARNRGLSIAKGEVIAFTDSDCIPAYDWIEKGVANLIRIPNIGLVGGKVEFTFTDPKRPTAVEVYDSITHLNQKEYVELMKFGATANLFTFRKVINHVGPFNAKLKSGGDYEWGHRVFSYGYELVYSDDTLVSHPARQSFRQVYRKLVRVMNGGQVLHGKSRQSFKISLARDLLPPIRRILCVCSHKRLKQSRQRVKAIVIILILYFVKVWNAIRFQLKQWPP